MSLYKPLTSGEQQAVKMFDIRAISEDFIKTTCQPEYLKAKTPEAREFWTNQARKSKEAADRMLFNSETHCGACGEFLSVHGHCWQCQYPPMDPKQDKPAPNVMWAVVSCAPSHPRRYELPHAPCPPYARFDTEAAAWEFIKGCGISADRNTRHWEAAYHAVSPPTCDTPFCLQCRNATPQPQATTANGHK